MVLVRVGADDVVELRDAPGLEVLDDRLALGADAGVYEQGLAPAGEEGGVPLADVYVCGEEAVLGQRRDGEVHPVLSPAPADEAEAGRRVHEQQRQGEEPGPYYPAAALPGLSASCHIRSPFL